MPETFSRADWGARPANPGPGELSAARVEGVALHWPGMASPLKTVDAVMAALRGWQNFHMDDRGWSDIAYQEAVDQAGNVYVLRGITQQSGANGNTDLNERFGAFLLVLAPGETPSEEMIAAVRRRVKAHRLFFPASSRIVGHGQIRPDGTACPGPIAQRLIMAGTFEPVAVVNGPRVVTRGPRVDDAYATLSKARRATKAPRRRRILRAAKLTLDKLLRPAR